MLYFCFFCAFAPIFHFNSAVFVDEGTKNILTPGAQSTLATPLITLWVALLCRNGFAPVPQIESWTYPEDEKNQ